MEHGKQDRGTIAKAKVAQETDIRAVSFFPNRFHRFKLAFMIPMTCHSCPNPRVFLVDLGDEEGASHVCAALYESEPLKLPLTCPRWGSVPSLDQASRFEAGTGRVAFAQTSNVLLYIHRLSVDTSLHLTPYGMFLCVLCNFPVMHLIITSVGIKFIDRFCSD